MLKLLYAIHPLSTGPGKVVEPIEGFQEAFSRPTPLRNIPGCLEDRQTCVGQGWLISDQNSSGENPKRSAPGAVAPGCLLVWASCPSCGSPGPTPAGQAFPAPHAAAQHSHSFCIQGEC